MTHIHSIVYHPGEPDSRPADHYKRAALETVKLIADHGLEGDQKAGKHPDRQINIMFLASLNRLRAKGFKTEPGAMGEQIVIDGITEKSLEPGSQLQLGESALVEVIKQRTGCDRFEAIQKKSPKKAAGRMGVYVKVLEGGTIKVGDRVEILPISMVER